MAENLDLRSAKSKNIADQVNNLSNTVVSPQVSDVVTNIITKHDTDASTIDQRYQSTPDVAADKQPVDNESPELIDDVGQDGIEFEHFFDGDFGQSEPSPHTMNHQFVA